MGPASARRLRGASPSVPAAASFPACGRVLSPRKERHTCWSGDEKRVILYFGYVPSGRRWSGLDDSAAPVSAGAASGAAAPPRRSQCEQRHFTWGQGRRSRRPLRARLRVPLSVSARRGPPLRHPAAGSSTCSPGPRPPARGGFGERTDHGGRRLRVQHGIRAGGSRDKSAAITLAPRCCRPLVHAEKEKAGGSTGCACRPS